MSSSVPDGICSPLDDSASSYSMIGGDSSSGSESAVLSLAETDTPEDSLGDW
jgi:hypothetical protein